MSPPPKTCIVKLSSCVKGKEGANLKSSVPAMTLWRDQRTNARIAVIWQQPTYTLHGASRRRGSLIMQWFISQKHELTTYSLDSTDMPRNLFNTQQRRGIKNTTMQCTTWRTTDPRRSPSYGVEGQENRSAIWLAESELRRPESTDIHEETAPRKDPSHGETRTTGVKGQETDLQYDWPRQSVGSGTERPELRGQRLRNRSGIWLAEAKTPANISDAVSRSGVTTW
jgi:hypothetical protein